MAADYPKILEVGSQDLVWHHYSWNPAWLQRTVNFSMSSKFPYSAQGRIQGGNRTPPPPTPIPQHSYIDFIQAWRTKHSYIDFIQAWRTKHSYIDFIQAWRTKHSYIDFIQAWRTKHSYIDFIQAWRTKHSYIDFIQAWRTKHSYIDFICDQEWVETRLEELSCKRGLKSGTRVELRAR